MRILLRLVSDALVTLAVACMFVGMFLNDGAVELKAKAGR